MESIKKKNGRWKIRNSEKKYQDDFIEIQVDSVVSPSGDDSTYATVKMKDGVAILPFLDQNTVILTRQHRYAVERESIEVISGGIEKGEKPFDAAQRELKEEAGIEAKELIDMGYMHLETSIIKGPVYLFLAKDLKITTPDQDDTEDIAILEMPFKDAVKKVMKNEITHGPSGLLILKAAEYLIEHPIDGIWVFNK